MNIAEVIDMAIQVGDEYLESNAIAELMHYTAISKGWESRREAPAPTNGRKGRIDLLLSHGGFSVAIEIDDRKIKEKSVAKLRSLSVDARVCVIARGVMSSVPEGIDAVVSIRDKSHAITSIATY